MRKRTSVNSQPCQPGGFVRTLSPVLVVLFGLLSIGSGAAAELTVKVIDPTGAPLEDAVVYAIPPSGKMPAAPSATAQINQINKRFTPLVSVVQSGTPVSFPNKDTVRHHVYSFSPAKVFELKLYSGVPAKPVLFDKPGLVVLGCNIHDHMLAYVLVVDTPFFAKTAADGSAKFADLPTGEYEIKAWHYGLPSQDAVVVQKISLTTALTPLTLTLPVDPAASKSAPVKPSPNKP